MRARSIILGGVAAVVAAGCGGSSGSDDGAPSGGAPDDGEPIALVGETDQGLRIRLDPADGGQVRLRFPADCRSEDDNDDDGDNGDASMGLHRHPFTVEVADDGSFSVDEEYVDEGTDGDESHITVRIEGAYADDGTAQGTLDATGRFWNGQGSEFSPDCVTGTVDWSADRPPAPADNVVVPSAVPMTIAATGPDLLVRTEAGELLRVDPVAGEARSLVGAGSATEPAGAAAGGGPVTPSTMDVGGGAGGAGVQASTVPLESTAPAVVAGGVWTGDPTTGVLTRYELDGGAATATVDEPVDRFVAGSDALWTVSTGAAGAGTTLARRDPTTGAVQASAPVANEGALLAGPAEVWYVHGTLAGGLLSRVDPATLALAETYEVEIPMFRAPPVTSADRIWWIDVGRLESVDLATGRVSTVDLPSVADDVAADATGVWTSHPDEAVLRRIEGGEVVRTVDVPDGWWDLAVGAEGQVWLAGRGPSGDDPQAILLDPAVTGG